MLQQMGFRIRTLILAKVTFISWVVTELCDMSHIYTFYPWII